MEIRSIGAEAETNTELNYDRLDDLVRRFERIFSFLVPAIAVIAALAFVGIFIQTQGVSPMVAYQSLFQSAFGTLYDIGNSLDRAVPLILAGLGIAFASRGGIVNLGAEGQIIAGGIFGTIAAIFISGIPSWIHIPICLLAGFIGGALWAAVPGFFYAKYGTNVIITTILLNDIANGLLGTLIKGPLKEEGIYIQSAMVAPSAKLSIILPETRLHSGILIAMALALILYLILFKTSTGFEIRTIGQNPIASRHSGMKVFWTNISLMLVAGGLAGMAGTVEILGFQYRLREAFLTSYGYEAVAVAMLGQKHPFGVVIAGILFGALKSGRSGMVRTVDLPASISMVLSGIIIFFVAISPMMKKLPRYFAMREMNSKRK